MTKNNLYTYKSQDMKTKPTEVISLKQCKGVKSAEDETKKDFSFRIDLGSIVFYFHSETTEQKEKWIGVISKARVSSCRSHPRQADDKPEDRDPVGRGRR